MTPVIPEGGYFIMADWSSHSTLNFEGWSCLYYLFKNLIHIYFLEDKVDLSSEDGTPDFRFAKWLSKNKKLQGIPPSAFFSEGSKSIGENYIRFCFIKVRIFLF